MSIANCPKCHRKGTYSAKFQQCSACGLGYESKSQAKRVESQRDNVAPDHNVTPPSNKVTPCPTCGQMKLATMQDHICDDACQEAEHKSIRCMLQIAPEPGEDCALCDEKKPSENTLRQRKWRAKNG